MSDYTDEEKELITKGIAGINILGMDRDVQIKIENMEKELTFRRFYFPGCDMRLRIQGKGIDTATVRYSKDKLVSFDPRYMEEYIKYANGSNSSSSAGSGDFYQWMIRYDHNSKTTIQLDFDNAFELIQNYYDNSGKMKSIFEKDENAYLTVCSVFGALKYFNKLESCKFNGQLLYPGFIEYVDQRGKRNSSYDITTLRSDNFEKFMSANASKINMCINKLEDLTGQSMYNFINKDNGYFAPERLAFGLNKDWFTVWNSYQQQYQDYKNKVWQILKDKQSLQICVNRDNSINQVAQGGEMTLTQMNNCVQNISNIDLDSGKGSESGKLAGADSGVAGWVDDLERVSSAEKDIKELNKQMKIAFIAICVLGLMFVGVTILYCFKLRSSKLNSSNTVTDIIKTH